MVKLEIVGSRYCAACKEMKRILDDRDIEYTYYDTFDYSERYNELNEIAKDEGYTAIPLVFADGECLGEGMGMLDRIDAAIGFDPENE